LYLPEKTVSALKIYSQRYDRSFWAIFLSTSACEDSPRGTPSQPKRALKSNRNRYERRIAGKARRSGKILVMSLIMKIKEFASHLTEEKEWQDLNHEPEESGRQTTGETETAAPSPEPAGAGLVQTEEEPERRLKSPQ
jgi:hypothetical protein